MKGSPRITHLSWGRLEVEGYFKHFKDVKLFPGGAREWDWNETGTRHSPGIQPDDVIELLGKGVTTVILSTGMNDRLRTAPETLQLLAQKGVAASCLKTEEAVRLYNEICKVTLVGALIHSTC